MNAKANSSKSCFVISPIGEAGSATRKRADLVYEFVISEVLGKSPYNYSIERADKLSVPGIITNQIIDRVISADLVVADLSERNPNVFYKLAVRHIAQKACIHLISHLEDIPFDNAAARTIQIDVNSLRSVDNAKSELARQVDFATGENRVVENPVTIALTLNSIKLPENAEASAIKGIVSQLSELSAAVHSLDSSLAKISASVSTQSGIKTDVPRSSLGIEVPKLSDRNFFSPSTGQDVGKMIEEALRGKNSSVRGNNFRKK